MQFKENMFTHNRMETNGFLSAEPQHHVFGWKTSNESTSPVQSRQDDYFTNEFLTNQLYTSTKPSNIDKTENNLVRSSTSTVFWDLDEFTSKDYSYHCILELPVDDESLNVVDVPVRYPKLVSVINQAYRSKDMGVEIKSKGQDGVKIKDRDLKSKIRESVKSKQRDTIATRDHEVTKSIWGKDFEIVKSYDRDVMRVKDEYAMFHDLPSQDRESIKSKDPDSKSKDRESIRSKDFDSMKSYELEQTKISKEREIKEFQDRDNLKIHNRDILKSRDRESTKLHNRELAKYKDCDSIACRDQDSIINEDQESLKNNDRDLLKREDQESLKSKTRDSMKSTNQREQDQVSVKSIEHIIEEPEAETSNNISIRKNKESISTENCCRNFSTLSDIREIASSTCGYTASETETVVLRQEILYQNICPRCKMLMTKFRTAQGKENYVTKTVRSEDSNNSPCTVLPIYNLSKQKYYTRPASKSYRPRMEASSSELNVHDYCNHSYRHPNEGLQKSVPDSKDNKYKLRHKYKLYMDERINDRKTSRNSTFTDTLEFRNARAKNKRNNLKCNKTSRYEYIEYDKVSSEDCETSFSEGKRHSRKLHSRKTSPVREPVSHRDHRNPYVYRVECEHNNPLMISPQSRSNVVKSMSKKFGRYRRYRKTSNNNVVLKSLLTGCSAVPQIPKTLA